MLSILHHYHFCEQLLVTIFSEILCIFNLFLIVVSCTYHKTDHLDSGFSKSLTTSSVCLLMFVSSWVFFFPLLVFPYFVLCSWVPSKFLSDFIVRCHLPVGIYSEKCVIRRCHRCANITELPTHTWLAQPATRLRCEVEPTAPGLPPAEHGTVPNTVGNCDA